MHRHQRKMGDIAVCIYLLWNSSSEDGVWSVYHKHGAHHLGK